MKYTLIASAVLTCAFLSTGSAQAQTEVQMPAPETVQTTPTDILSRPRIETTVTTNTVQQPVGAPVSPFPPKPFDRSAIHDGPAPLALPTDPSRPAAPAVPPTPPSAPQSPAAPQAPATPSSEIRTPAPLK